MPYDILLFVLGVALLCWGADVFVSGASRLASTFKISPMLIAVTVVAFGSSAPELFVAAGAALDGHSKMAVGNIIGSNICNIALVIGLCSLIRPFKMDTSFLSKEFVFL